MAGERYYVMPDDPGARGNIAFLKRELQQMGARRVGTMRAFGGGRNYPWGVTFSPPAGQVGPLFASLVQGRLKARYVQGKRGGRKGGLVSGLRRQRVMARRVDGGMYGPRTLKVGGRVCQLIWSYKRRADADLVADARRSDGLRVVVRKWYTWWRLYNCGGQSR